MTVVITATILTQSTNDHGNRDHSRYAYIELIVHVILANVSAIVDLLRTKESADSARLGYSGFLLFPGCIKTTTPRNKWLRN